MHPGLAKLFFSLSRATKVVEKKREAHTRVHTHIKKLKTRRSVKGADLAKLEKHIIAALSHKLPRARTVQRKEKELDRKIHMINELLSHLGKKVDEVKFKQQLEKKKKSIELLSETEDKLYGLEARYYVLKEDPSRSEKLLKRIETKISELKEKIRDLKK